MGNNKMKFVNLFALAALVSYAEAVKISTLPDVRPDTVTEEDIAAHEAARNEAAKVKKNPQAALLASIKTDLEQINKDMSFGVSFSQTKRNDHARELCQKVATAIMDYT